jgi:hypothetical protein
LRPSTHSASYKNIDGFFGTIIASGKATLHELRTIYTLEDAFLIWEAVVIPKYNEYMAAEEAKKRAERK